MPNITFSRPKNNLTERQFDILFRLINHVYAVSEKELWYDDYQRITDQELQDVLSRDELIVAFEDGKPVGCVEVKLLNQKTAVFSMLVAHPKIRGQKVGAQLVFQAEEWAKSLGCLGMRLELLTPHGWIHKDKQFLFKWYTRIGYNITEKIEMKEKYPELINKLRVECDFTVYLKSLS